MTWIKICGTTNLEDALLAVEAGADAVGFVFCEKSPRNIEVEAARAIVQKMPGSVEKVGVFVGASAGRIGEVAERVALTAVQLYQVKEKSSSADWLALGHKRKLIVAVSGESLRNGGILVGNEAKEAIHALLVDSGSGDRPGGTGTKFEWEKSCDSVRALSLMLPVIVAGGLTPENVGEAINILRPWGVDVASGVEAGQGKKDPGKVRAFVNAVRAADKPA